MQKLDQPEKKTGKAGGKIIIIGAMVAVLSIICGCFALFGLAGLPTLVNIFVNERKAIMALPLSPTVRADLCHRFEVDDQRLCITRKWVTGDEFLDVLRGKFNRENATTFAEVDAVIGHYRMNDCDDEFNTKDGRDTICVYDFDGDDIFPFFFYFNAQQELRMIELPYSDVP